MSEHKIRFVAWVVKAQEMVGKLIDLLEQDPRIKQ
jgi:hypothetical protein